MQRRYVEAIGSHQVVPPTVDRTRTSSVVALSTEIPSNNSRTKRVTSLTSTQQIVQWKRLPVAKLSTNKTWKVFLLLSIAVGITISLFPVSFLSTNEGMIGDFLANGLLELNTTTHVTQLQQQRRRLRREMIMLDIGINARGNHTRYNKDESDLQLATKNKESDKSNTSIHQTDTLVQSAAAEIPSHDYNASTLRATYNHVPVKKIECWNVENRCALWKNRTSADKGTDTITRNVSSPAPPAHAKKTLALSDPFLRDGYRNQFMRFVVFTVYAINNGFEQMLLPSIRWNCDHRKVKFDSVPFELLFDVDHWNNNDTGLPRLVAHNKSEHDDWDPFTGMFRGSCDVLDDFLRGEGIAKDSIFNRTKHYENPTPYGGGGSLGTLFYDYMGYDQSIQHVFSPLLNKSLDFRNDVEARIIRAMRPSTTVEQILQRTLGGNGEPPYMVLHARVEPEMLIHLRCLDKKVYNLTTIFDMIRGMEHANVSNPSLYIAIGMAEMQEGNPFNEFQLEHELNMKALRNALLLGINLPSGNNLKVSVGALNEAEVETCANEIVSAVVSFEIAVRAEIFIGTYISTWSTTVWKARLAHGKGGNFAYTPSGLVNITGSVPFFDC